MAVLNLQLDDFDRVVQGMRLLVQERHHTERKSCQELLDALNKRLEIELALKERTNAV